jgi:hypothetical protein
VVELVSEKIVCTKGPRYEIAVVATCSVFFLVSVVSNCDLLV